VVICCCCWLYPWVIFFTCCALGLLGFWWRSSPLFISLLLIFLFLALLLQGESDVDWGRCEKWTCRLARLPYLGSLVNPTSRMLLLSKGLRPVLRNLPVLFTLRYSPCVACVGTGNDPFVLQYTIFTLLTLCGLCRHRFISWRYSSENLHHS
jgi:hypothetical protein